MIWSNGIKGKIAEAGLNKSQFAEKMGWSRETLRKKLSMESDWTVSQVEKACAILNIDDRAKYFFAS